MSVARGRCGGYTLVDLPGTYSLEPRSAEEAVTRDYLDSGAAEAVLVVCDAGCLARNLVLALQCRRRCPRVLVCVNLLDEAKRRGITVDCELLSRELGLPVVGTVARSRSSRGQVLGALEALCAAPPRLTEPGEEEPGLLLREAERLERLALHRTAAEPDARDRRWDRLLTGKWTAFPLLIVLLLGLFSLSIRGANLPSAWLTAAFGELGDLLRRHLTALGAPAWLLGLLLDGAYQSLAWVTAVMLPPMAIFFPLFSLLEDAGFLPRVAYNLDRPFARCGGCGKQSLCMMMGLGCNAVGVTGSRILDTERERLLAVLTNSLTPCNGRFPLLITLLSLFFGARGLLPPLLLTGLLLFSLAMSFGATALLSATVLRGEPSPFVLELPPYRRVELGKTLLRSLLDRTLVVLGRAVSVAAPAGALLWLLASTGLLPRCAAALEPLGRFLGMDGAILLAFVLGLPANETVLPILLMIYSAGGSLIPAETAADLHGLLLREGWTAQTALCVLIFTVLHWPCSTTLLTVRRETGSWKWTALAAALPTALGVCCCALIAALCRIL